MVLANPSYEHRQGTRATQNHVAAYAVVLCAESMRHARAHCSAPYRLRDRSFDVAHGRLMLHSRCSCQVHRIS